MKIVVVDDNPPDLKHFTSALMNRGDVEVLAVSSVIDNLEPIRAYGAEMVLLDDRLGPVLLAEDSLRTISAELGLLPTVVMSSDVMPARRSELIRLGAIECVEKDALDEAMLDLAVAMAGQRDQVLRGGAGL